MAKDIIVHKVKTEEGTYNESFRVLGYATGDIKDVKAHFDARKKENLYIESFTVVKISKKKKIKKQILWETM